MNDHVRLHCLRHAESENVVTGTAGAQPSAALTSLVAAHPGGTIAVVGHVASLTTGLGVLCGLGGRVWGRRCRTRCRSSSSTAQVRGRPGGAPTGREND